jgi:hypothetical protein
MSRSLSREGSLTRRRVAARNERLSACKAAVPLLVCCVALTAVPCSLAACKEYTMELEQEHLDPCGAFVVKGRGCFETDLQRDIAIETYRWTIYERYKQIFLESRKSNTYGETLTILLLRVDVAYDDI